jgi:hypothetical protein
MRTSVRRRSERIRHDILSAGSRFPARPSGENRLVADLLSIYLRDHLAGSVVARRRCAAACERAGGTDLGAFLAELLREIEADQAQLRLVLRRIHAPEPSFRKVAAAVGERLGRLKPNGRLVGPSPLGVLVDLELLSLGVEGKRRLWQALDALEDPRLQDVDFAVLVERAERQIERIEAQRLAAARTALTA